MLRLIQHAFLSTFRGGFFRGGMAAKLVLGFLSFYFLFMAAVLSLVLPDLARNAIEGSETIVDVAARFLVYYVLLDIIFRFLVQSFSGVNLQHYILLPLSYKKLIHFMLGRSLFNFFNIITLIIFIPFAMRGVAVDMGWYTAVCWLTGMVALMLGNSLVAVYLKFLFSGSLRASLIMVGILVLVFSTELLGETAMATTSWSANVFGGLLSGPAAMLFIVFPVLAYWLNHRYLSENRYAENARVAASDSDGIWSQLEWQGEGRVSALLATEWKLILRHKRTRTLLMFSTIFLAYGLIFYRDDSNWSSMLIFAGVFITGFGAMNYGQYLSAWESRFFDGIFSRNFEIEDYYRAKFRLLFMMIGVCYVLSLLYTLMDVKYFYLHTACFLFNIGFNSFIMLFFSTYQRKALDLNAGSAFNYQGTSALQFLLVMPLLIVPMLLFFMANLLYGEMIGYAVVGGAGLLSLCFYKIWIKGISDNFREKKHAMATGFRKKD